jgi:hypothetical protein
MKTQTELRQIKGYLEDIQRYLKELWFRDLTSLSDEILNVLENESLSLSVTLSAIDNIKKDQMNEK